MTATQVTRVSVSIGPSVASTLLASGEASFPCLPSHAVRNIVLVYIGDVLGSFPAYQLSRCYLDVAKPLVGVVAHIFRQLATLDDLCRTGIVCSNGEERAVELVKVSLLEVVFDQEMDNTHSGVNYSGLPY